jgi:PTS system fructose-specific IIC component
VLPIPNAVGNVTGALIALAVGSLVTGLLVGLLKMRAA